MLPFSCPSIYAEDTEEEEEEEEEEDDNEATEATEEEEAEAELESEAEAEAEADEEDTEGEGGVSSSTEAGPKMADEEVKISFLTSARLHAANVFLIAFKGGAKTGLRVSWICLAMIPEFKLDWAAVSVSSSLVLNLKREVTESSTFGEAVWMTA
jgi:hypothetical protein